MNKQAIEWIKITALRFLCFMVFFYFTVCLIGEFVSWGNMRWSVGDWVEFGRAMFIVWGCLMFAGGSAFYNDLK